MRPKYTDFAVSGPRLRPDARRAGEQRSYVGITCPHCKIEFIEIPVEALASNKASKCKCHLMTCPNIEASERPNKKPRDSPEKCTPIDDELVTIYALVLRSTGRRMYTGRTKDPKRRLNEHGQRSSKCRLVHNAFRKHGPRAFDIDPIMRCHASDADANESFWIIENKTLFPDGYNLRHGSKAGIDASEGDGDEGVGTRLVTSCTGVVPFTGVADEARASAEAWLDVAELTEGREDDQGHADSVCKELLRGVHPDKQDGDGEGSRMYSASQVAAMLNTVREALP